MATVLFDSREQKNSHIIKYLKAKNIPFERIKLNVGDYSFIFNGTNYEDKITIERKACIDELVMNFTKDKARLRREFERAKGMKVILMIEDTQERLLNHEYRSRMKPTDFKNILETWRYKYGFEVHWVSKDKAAEFILRKFNEFVRKNKVKEGAIDE